MQKFDIPKFAKNIQPQRENVNLVPAITILSGLHNSTLTLANSAWAPPSLSYLVYTILHLPLLTPSGPRNHYPIWCTQFNTDLC